MNLIVDPVDDNYAIVDGQFGVTPSFGPAIAHAPTIAELDQMHRATGVYVTGFPRKANG